MRHLSLSLLVCFLFAIAIPGCGGSSGPAKPVADTDKINEYLANNPDQDVDETDEDMESDEDDQ